MFLFYGVFIIPRIMSQAEGQNEGDDDSGSKEQGSLSNNDPNAGSGENIIFCKSKNRFIIQ